jgi:hypothetical protein
MTVRATTGVSGPGATPAWKGRVCALARAWLGAVLLTMLPGCLIDDPPPYPQPKQTPPRLVYHRAFPPLYQILRARTPDPIPFSIPVASEDVGEGLQAVFLVNGGIRGFDTLPPSTLDDESERLVSFTHNVENDNPVCTRFQIRVGHASNLPAGTALDTVDQAEAYWFAYLNLPADQSAPLEGCFK